MSSSAEDSAVEVGSLHVCQLPAVTSIPVNRVWACACGNRFAVAPKGLLGKEWTVVEPEAKVDAKEKETTETTEENTREKNTDSTDDTGSE